MLLQVPVKPHVKEFFTSAQMFGPEPCEVRRNSRIGELIAATFSQYPLRSEDLEDLEAVEAVDPAKLNLKLTFDVKTQLITDSKLMQFGKVLEAFFEMYAVAFVNGRMDVYPSANGAAERFIELHQINEEHYSVGAVRKMAARARQSKDPFFSKLSVSGKTELVQIGQKAVQVAA